MIQKTLLDAECRQYGKFCKSPFATSSGEPFVDPPKSANLAIDGL